MSYLSLKEAIDSPPALIGNSATESKPSNEGIQLCKNGASPFSGKNSQGTKPQPESNSATKNESVLSRWSDRPSIQSFMNAIQTMSVKKQQMELQKQQQSQEMFDKFRLFNMHQGQQVLAKQQLEMKKDQEGLPQHQQLFQMISPIKPTSSNNSTLFSNEQNVTNATMKPKVRKVMKGGVLVSMPVNARHPPGGSSLEQNAVGESGPGMTSDKSVVFDSGNILDDILARSQGNKEQSINVARKKGIVSKTVAGKQTGSHKTGETMTSSALQTKKSICNERDLHKIGETPTKSQKTVRNKNAITVSDGKNININLSLTIKLPGEEEKAEIKHTTMIKRSSPAKTGDVVFDSCDSSVVDKSLAESNMLPKAQGPHVKLNTDIKCLVDRDDKIQTPIQTIVISDTDNEEQGICLEPTTANSENSQANLNTTEYFNIDVKPNPAEMHHISSSEVVKQESTANTNINIKPDPDSKVADQLVVNTDAECKPVNHDFHEEGQINLETEMSGNAEQDNKMDIEKPEKFQPGSARCEPVIDSKSKGVCGGNESASRKNNNILETSQVNSLGTNFYQGNEGQKQSTASQSPGSPVGDLVIDLDSESELSAGPARRVKMRKRYSSRTSESSSEEPQVSSFAWMRSLSQQIREGGEETMEQEVTHSSTLPERDHSHIASNASLSKDHLPTAEQKQSNLTTTDIFLNEKDATKTYEKPTQSTKEDTEDGRSRKRKEFDDNLTTKTGEENKKKRYDEDASLDEDDCFFSGIVTRSMIRTDQNESHDNSKTSSHENQQRNGDQKKRAATSKRTQGKQVKQSRRNRNGKRNVALENQGGSNKNTKRGPPSRPLPGRLQSGKNQRTGHSREGRKETDHNNQHSLKSKAASSLNAKGRKDFSSDCLQRRSSLGTQGRSAVAYKDEDEAPSLLSMVTDKTVDVTVVQKEISDGRKNKKRGGKKKKKKNKVTEWFLRHQKEIQQMQEKRRQQPREEETPIERVPCILYQLGKCAKGATCQFKHEKRKELCRYYVSNVCYKHLGGMCPRMHEEFPCMFYHRKSYCSSGDSCKYSHAPLNNETREILEKYVSEVTERRLVAAATGQSDTISCNQTSAIISTEEKITVSPSSNLTTGTNSNLPLPSTVIFSTVSTSGVGPNPDLTTQPFRKPSIGTPKVKRLCSLASYKPQLLSSLLSGVEESQNTSEETKSSSDSSTKKTFLPGMFKER